MVYYEESGKNAIVTGAERGIGKGIALRLAQAGYNVFFTYYFKDSYAEELKRSIEKLGRRCVALKADFRDPSVVETVVKSAAKSLGGIDLLVNNAAIMPPRAYQYEYTAEHIDEVYAVNYRGYMLLMDQKRKKGQYCKYLIRKRHPFSSKIFFVRWDKSGNSAEYGKRGVGCCAVRHSGQLYFTRGD